MPSPFLTESKLGCLVFCPSINYHVCKASCPTTTPCEMWFNAELPFSLAAQVPRNVCTKLLNPFSVHCYKMTDSLLLVGISLPLSCQVDAVDCSSCCFAAPLYPINFLHGRQLSNTVLRSFLLTISNSMPMSCTTTAVKQLCLACVQTHPDSSLLAYFSIGA